MAVLAKSEVIERQARWPRLVAQALLAFACTSAHTTPAPPARSEPPKGTQVSSLRDASPPRPTPVERDAVAPSPVSPKLHARNGLTWYEDAPLEAFEAARRDGKLVLADLWAPWCHTCLSMQEFVLSSANLPRASEHYVFLAIDTERAENAAFLEKFPVGVWPTFYAVSVDPKASAAPEVVGRWLGAASPSALARFLDDNARLAELSGKATTQPDDPLVSIRTGDRLATEGKFAEAAAAYGTALARARPDFPRRAETLVAQIAALGKAKDVSRCLLLGKAGMNQTGVSSSAVDFAYDALDCADESSADARTATEVRRAAAQRLAPLCERGSSELSPDDQADACDRLQHAREKLGDAAGAGRASLLRLEVLERAAQGKPDDVALTYDWARVDALTKLGRAEEALDLCIGRARALPDNYNPPAYQARIYKQLGRWNDGLAAVERALSLAYGPRKIGLLTLKADLLLGAGKKDEARAIVEEQLRSYRALPAGQKQLAAEARAEQRLKDLR